MSYNIKSASSLLNKSDKQAQRDETESRIRRGTIAYNKAVSDNEDAMLFIEDQMALPENFESPTKMVQLVQEYKSLEAAVEVLKDLRMKLFGK